MLQVQGQHDEAMKEFNYPGGAEDYAWMHADLDELPTDSCHVKCEVPGYENALARIAAANYRLQLLHDTGNWRINQVATLVWNGG